jgi:cyclohexanone monooxygenase
MSPTHPAPASPDASDTLDALIVGAGFAGLYMLYKLRQLGLRALVVERAPGVGGTWYWNRYPGARCDVESLLYCYTFSPELDREWTWSERYATQPEILRYLNFAADRLDLRKDLRLSHEISAAHWDNAGHFWSVDAGHRARYRASFCIMATGCLSEGRVPDLPGLAEFSGSKFHTAGWPQEAVDFTERRVGVIGTGSSGIQVIPQIARQAARLYVFQRTANFSVPAMNARLRDEQRMAFRTSASTIRQRARRGEITGSGDLMICEDLRATRSIGLREVSPQRRREVFEQRWNAGGALLAGSFKDVMLDDHANHEAAEFARAKIQSLVKDARTAQLLTPTGYPFGAKRLCVDTGYYETFNRANVELVDLRAEPIERIVPEGIRTRDRLVHLDAIVFATGFDAMTGALRAIDIRGVHGLTLQDAWRAGPVNYLGLAVVGFPNFFMITGPGSPSVLSNVVLSIEQHVELIAECITHMRDRGLTRMEAEASAQKSWVEHVNQVASATLFTRADSWYLGANVPGKPRVFMPYVGGIGQYRRKCNEVAAKGYEGFRFARAEPNASRSRL